MKKSLSRKQAYICGPLTELDLEELPAVKNFCEKLADVCEKVLGVRAFVPHEHYDPIKYAHYTPLQIDEVERRQVCKETNLLVVVAVAPSWGGGIEVEMANVNKIPAVLLCAEKKLKDRRISRLLRGNPAFVEQIVYNDETDALERFSSFLKSIKSTNSRK